MLDVESEFSSCVSQAVDITYSLLPCSSAILRLVSSTSRMLRPRRLRISFNRSEVDMSHPCTQNEK